MNQIELEIKHDTDTVHGIAEKLEGISNANNNKKKICYSKWLLKM